MSRRCSDFDGPAKVGGRLVEGRPGRRLPARLGQCGDRAVTVTQRPRHAAVVGDLGRGCRPMRRAAQQRGQRKVQRRPPCRWQPVVKDLAEQVVAEPGAAGFVVLQNRGADGAGRASRTAVSAAVPGDGGHRRDREPPARRPRPRRAGLRPHRAAGRGGEPARRPPRAGRRSPGPGQAAHPATRAAARSAGRRTGCPAVRSCTAWISGAVRALTAHLSISWPTSSARQPGELQQLGLPGQLGQQRGGAGMIPGRHLDVAVRPDDQRSGVMQLAGEEHAAAAATTRPPSADRRRRPPAAAAPPGSAGYVAASVVGAEADRGLVAQAAAPGSALAPVSPASTASPAPSGVPRPAPAPPGSTARSPARRRPPSIVPHTAARPAPSRRPPPRRRARSCPCRPHPRAGRPRPHRRARRRPPNSARR